MAICDGLKHINIDKPLSENSTLLESVSPLKQIKSIKIPDQSSSFTEISSEIQHFKENSHSHSHNSSESSFSCSPISSNSMFSSDANTERDENGISSIHTDKNGSFPSNFYNPYGQKKQYKHSDSLSSSVNSDNLQICTEGLGFESFDDVDDLLKTEILNNSSNNCQLQEEAKTRSSNRDKNHPRELRRSRTCCVREFPPPISCIGKSGKPFVSFKSFRQEGRFILKEIRVPEVLHACRENGRLKLQFILSDDDDDDVEDGKKDENIEKNN